MKPLFHNRYLPTIALLTVACAMLTGCGEYLDTSYGERRGMTGQSIHGTGVLSDMFEQRGHKVISWSVLSPKLQEDTDCIVWFPDCYDTPGDDVCEWLEIWLDARPGRTLIYVGRDFDAEPDYWAKVEPGAPSEQAPLIRRRKKEARSNAKSVRKGLTEQLECSWFSVDQTAKSRKVRTLGGEWARGVDPAKVEIELASRVDPYGYYAPETLLESNGEPLVSRIRFGDYGDGSQLIVVANGSFLLNLPLVNCEHRKLAGRLIDEAGPPVKSVVFLESGYGDPEILEEEPTVAMPNPMALLLKRPFCWIFLQLGIVGVALCFSRWPIFGIARELPLVGKADFGKHIQALAKLLQRSRDRAYATTRLLHYQQTTKEEMTKQE
ncbi:MAG: hypothetical protein HQ567_22900 [Candidatus Nealsonbacteria bacterium]|nr:hypothetical protein [Candidatus Nealsonbacteria bacterium]